MFQNSRGKKRQSGNKSDKMQHGDAKEVMHNVQTTSNLNRNNPNALIEVRTVIGGKSLTCTMDTGTTISAAMSYKTAIANGFRMKRSSYEPYLRCANGMKLKVMGVTTQKMSLRIKNTSKILNVSFQIVENLPVSVMIGTSLLRRLQICIKCRVEGNTLSFVDDDEEEFDEAVKRAINERTPSKSFSAPLNNMVHSTNERIQPVEANGSTTTIFSARNKSKGLLPLVRPPKEKNLSVQKLYDQLLALQLMVTELTISSESFKKTVNTRQNTRCEEALQKHQVCRTDISHKSETHENLDKPSYATNTATQQPCSVITPKNTERRLSTIPAILLQTNKYDFVVRGLLLFIIVMSAMEKPLVWHQQPAHGCKAINSAHQSANANRVNIVQKILSCTVKHLMFKQIASGDTLRLQRNTSTANATTEIAITDIKNIRLIPNGSYGELVAVHGNNDSAGIHSNASRKYSDQRPSKHTYEWSRQLIQNAATSNMIVNHSQTLNTEIDTVFSSNRITLVVQTLKPLKINCSVATALPEYMKRKHGHQKNMTPRVANKQRPVMAFNARPATQLIPDAALVQREKIVERPVLICKTT